MTLIAIVVPTEMKRRLVIAIGITLVSLVLACVIAIPIWNAQFDGIDGYYKAGLCACPGEIFDEYRDGQWYITCTGKHEPQLLGTVIAESNHWNVIKGTQVIWIVEVEDEEIYSTSPRTKRRVRIDRIRNPWRLWLPSIFGKEL